MKLVLAVAPDKFRDEEFEVPQQVFSEAGIKTVVASTRPGTCQGMIGATAEATSAFADLDPEEYDGIVVVGGIGSQDHLWTDADLKKLVQTYAHHGKVVAAICLSPVVLALAGVLDGKNATVFKSPASVKEMEQSGARLVDEAVVSDGKIVTANGPAAARKFAEAVLAALPQ
ncbi:protease I [Methanofollis sp. W23]|uniref:DJ-1/PfpI family protein n=1 Tax=Methanofollis sp. W23 TaxID=2817849 RepID=UPI001AE1EA80|nr:DJ-1/PfpI family protein [Methanofollis sp. W23]MBP2145786.1 protease I [Methanofollis sp. W23]